MQETFIYVYVDVKLREDIYIYDHNFIKIIFLFMQLSSPFANSIVFADFKDQ
jgi:hypothetical protein